MAEIIVPELGESISEGTITKWFVKVGDTVNQGDILLELETDKVNIEISAESSGAISALLRQDGDSVAVGEVIGTIGTAEVSTVSSPAAEQKSEPAPAAAPTELAAVGSSSAAVNATPAARKLAREQGVDLTQVQSKDAIGRIYPEDVRTHQSLVVQQTTSSVASVASAAPAPAPVAASAASVVAGKEVERKRMSRRRATIAKRLVEAQHTAAMLTTFNEVDMTAILDLRKRRKQSFFDKNEVNLGFMSFFTKAVVGALKQYPLLNAEIDGEDIVVKKFTTSALL